MFPLLLLHSIQQLQEERTLSAIHHIFIGKKSSQTFQDMHAYQLASFYGCYRTLKRSTIQEEVERLKRNGYVFENDEGRLQITQEGASYTQRHWHHYPFDYFGGKPYHSIDEVFSARLLLFIQTASNIAKGQRQFIPIEDNRHVLQWVKSFYATHQHDLTNVLNTLSDELYRILCSFPTEYAEIIVLRMTGFHRYGLSKEQLATKYGLTIHDISLLLTALNHYLLSNVVKQSTTYPMLYQFCRDGVRDIPLTKSGRQTRYWLLKGYSIDQITNIRHLKRSTIEDHLIEIALADPTFSISRFIPEEAVKHISQTANQLKTNKLKKIRESLDEDYSYFQIRLVLASLTKGNLK
ncbi:helix-turn-helix domain-containing protein [Pontibacillus litoralis]|uniref:Helicase Helix-turn-helix domain-containing protein n=1 Tax=Pontibacillus litoralis JSM 072002 TaxID=1385512 RepID=A0A0A5G4G5_9BACI|nr:helix-turn-helix domain-containing protein [Pontibacillus litoralis]KGX86013.1 hypothetical protein N784_06130 [Pontibacillus litoralis JSM 072002]